MTSHSRQDRSSDQAIERAILLTSPLKGPRRRGNRWRSVIRPAVVLMLLGVTLSAAYFGVVARNRVFVVTEDVRMWWDINNGFNHGRNVVRTAREQAGLPADEVPTGFWGKLAQKTTTQPAGEPRRLTWGEYWTGYVSFYDRVVARANRRNPEAVRYGLDYAPIRLLIMSSWMKYTLDLHPDAAEYRNEFAWPLMHFNTVVAGLSAVAMFAAVVAWRRRCDAARVDGLVYQPFSPASGERIFQPHDRAWIAALFAALILWLNPAVVINSHGFVQWDTWIIPFVIAGMGLIAMERWGWAGLALGLSMGLKGQLLFVLPAFALIPVFRGHWTAAARFAIGFCLSWLAVGLPWLIPNSTAWLWLGSVVALATAFAKAGYPRRLGLAWWLAVGVTVALVTGPFLNAEWAMAIMTIAMPLVAAIVLLPWILPRGSAGLAVGLVALAATASAAHRFDGSWNWFLISYVFPSYQYKQMFMGPVANLPMLLQGFGWRLGSVVWASKLGEETLELTLRHMLVAVNAAGCAGFALAAAIQQKRKDPAMLIALSGPWVFAFTVLPQMHERYLTWGAALVGVGFAVSIGMGLLHWVVVSVSFSMVFQQMLRSHSEQMPRLQAVLEQLRTPMAAVLILTSLVYLYAAFARSRPRAGLPA